MRLRRNSLLQLHTCTLHIVQLHVGIKTDSKIIFITMYFLIIDVNDVFAFRENYTEAK